MTSHGAPGTTLCACKAMQNVFFEDLVSGKPSEGGRAAPWDLRSCCWVDPSREAAELSMQSEQSGHRSEVC